MFFGLCVAVLGLDDCPKEIIGEWFGRCRVGNTGVRFVQGEDVAMTALYLHNADGKAKGTITLGGEAENPEQKSHGIGPGEGYQVIYAGTLNESVLSCSGCFVSVWHSHYNKDKATYVSDAAGAIYEGTVMLPDRFPGFFDFGDSCVVYVNTLVHKRESALDLYYYNETSKSVIKINGVGANIDEATTKEEEQSPEYYGYKFHGPGILHISSSPFIPAQVYITVGSKVSMPKEFGNNVNGWGKFGTATLKNGKFKWTECAPKEGLLIHPAVEARFWQYVAYSVLGVTVALFLSSLVLLGCFIRDDKRDQKEAAMKIAELRSAESPLVGN